MARIRWLCVVLALLFFAAVVDETWGRAGGGASFSSGGGSSYSSSSSSSSYSSSTSRSSRSSTRGPTTPPDPAVVIWSVVLPGVTLLIVVVATFVLGRINKKMRFERARAQTVDFDSLADKTGFLRRFSAAFLQIQNAWCKQDMRPVQHFVSDGVLERFTLQILEQRDRGYRDHMEQIRVHSLSVAEQTTESPFEVLTVMVTASAIDYRVSIETGHDLSGSRSPDSFTEYWTFIRRRGAQTEPELGLIEGFCPNCGDSISINQTQNCSSCDALLRSGEYDWVLSEITQACVWKPHRSADDKTITHYRENCDPGFNRQHLEDRASVIFWRIAMADRLGDTTPLMKVATSPLCETIQAEYASASRHGDRRYLGNRSVGTVDFRGIVQGEDKDQAVMEIQWSAHVFEATRRGKPRDLGRWRRYRRLYVLMRKKGVETDLGRAIDSAHCPNCGAPESDVASHGCEYCHTVLNDGSHDWILAEYHDAHSQEAQQWLAMTQTVATFREKDAQFAPAPTDADVLSWSISVLAEDKRIDDQERKIIEQLARKQGMPAPMLSGLLESALQGDLEAPKPKNAKTRRAWIERIVDAALRSADVDADERCVLTQLGKRAGLADYDINLLINKRRSRCLRQADGSKGGSAPDQQRGATNRALLEALCCLMAVDGKATKSERDAIVNVLRRAGALLTSQEIEQAIDDFVTRVKRDGLQLVFDRCLEDVRRRCKAPAGRTVLRRALKLVAKSDGETHRREKAVIARFLAACQPQTNGE